ncbi:hypothetical protein AK812_SmicGene1535 [Symbiodinium microadriaticum]|uniref:Uncharacterized protein n=1 Tax=Symbiodinium microadriaticum TaxID=2951 RepID=A0A1Q9F3S2_SYMMI|nr:hypothetical protein AK812_SmicGene1535 [Symbiodinium microadriaticum]
MGNLPSHERVSGFGAVRWHAADLRILPENAVLFFSSNENAWWEILLDGRWCRHAPGPQYWTELSAEELQLLDAQTRNDEEAPCTRHARSFYSDF